MGRFVNPGNEGFRVALNSEVYIDKTELLSYTNRVLDTNQAFICNSRPRRFGKSITANMLSAYYSRGCDSAELFEGLKIAGVTGWEQYLNQFDVIHFDVQWCLTLLQDASCLVSYMEENIIAELKQCYPEILERKEESLADILSVYHELTGKKIIIIIDEWDAVIREYWQNERLQEEYINFLRSLFKGTEPTKFIKLAYLTGILPIKKLKTQSALNNFDEFTMINPGVMAPYIGFLEEEVEQLCIKYEKNFEEVKKWYDGYLLADFHVYNPKAVVGILMQNEFQSYWSQTGTYDAILPFITMDFDGLKSAVIEMLSGNWVEIDPYSYQNDMVSFKDKDDVLTLLVHMGYLAYHKKYQKVYIPNEEIRNEFIYALKRTKWNEYLELQRLSAKLLDATLELRGKEVAEIIEEIHNEFASNISYHDENSLSSVLSIGYLSAMQYYFKPVREFPTGRGFADFILLPKAEYSSEYPAMVIELKWNKNVSAALNQIKEKKYPHSIETYYGNILLVGINYDKKTKKHECIIEEYSRKMI
ncbi:MAG: AAA family ATPase [Lachnospiraceae bacterium]|nr:AAA family ATPase [Lachnospiraceae bacterium]